MKKLHDPKIESFLDALGEEYKQMLLEELIEGSESLDNLSISKLVSIDAEIKRYIRRKRASIKYRRFQFLGIAYVCTGLFILLMTEIISSFQNAQYLAPEGLIQIMSLILCFVGIIATIIPLIRVQHHNIPSQAHSKPTKLIEYDVITTWRELEAICTDISLKNKTVSNRSVIHLLSQEQLINTEEEKELLAFLKIRNAIIHSSDAKPTDAEMLDGIKKINKIQSNIYKKILPNS